MIQLKEKINWKIDFFFKKKKERKKEPNTMGKP